jgi:nitrogen regulatory protein PII
MKRIDAFIDTARLSTVRDELKKLGIQSFWFRRSMSSGRTPGAKVFYRSLEMKDSATRGLELTLVVADEQLRHVVRVLETHSVEGEILVSSLEEAFRVAVPAVKPLLTSVS